MLEIKSAVVVVVRILIKYNGLCWVLADFNYFYIEEPVPSTNFHVREMPFACIACMLRARSSPHAICEGLWKRSHLTVNAHRSQTLAKTPFIGNDQDDNDGGKIN